MPCEPKTFLDLSGVKERRSLEKEYEQESRGFPLQSACFSCHKSISTPTGLLVCGDYGVYGSVLGIGQTMSPAPLPSSS